MNLLAYAIIAFGGGFLLWGVVHRYRSDRYLRQIRQEQDNLTEWRRQYDELITNRQFIDDDIPPSQLSREALDILKANDITLPCP